MHKTYLIRALLGNVEEDVCRDIEIEAGESLEALHRFLLRAFELDEGEMASFFASDQNWTQGEEIPLFDLGESDESKSMSNTPISDILKEKGNRLIYVYDFLLMWTFMLELVKVEEREETGELPRVTLSLGERPAEPPQLEGGHTDPLSSGEEGDEDPGDPEENDDTWEY